ncbi:hypothetical protein JCM12296A_52550 [Desulfosarcina cetonica]|uniref:single-stranded DNA-binding protein n=1 Tax=Desulfosarcina cetonica TaxID=90730 RepID=UPI0006CFB7D6|nr:single-stranded DNA-binding protein [Desulfosarcina cetonica]
MVNLSILVGNLVDSPDLKYTKEGTPVAHFDMITSETWSDGDRKKESTERHHVEVWRGRGEACAKILTKGSLVYVLGMKITNKWDDDRGQTRYSTVIRAQDVKFISVKK